MATTRRWHGGAVLVLGVAGLLMAAGVSLADTSDVQTSRGIDLPELVDVQTQRVSELEQLATDLSEQVDALADQTAGSPAQTVRDQATRRAVGAGFVDVTGPGLTVTLDDAPVPADLDNLPPGTSPDDFVVHQQDVEAVVNALWDGGAEAMQIMDRRITSVSAVRCVGNVIILDGQVYSPPFTITAIGNPERLGTALESSDPVAVYREWADYIGLGYAVQEHTEVELPAATGPTTLLHAEPIAEPEA